MAMYRGMVLLLILFTSLLVCSACVLLLRLGLVWLILSSGCTFDAIAQGIALVSAPCHARVRAVCSRRVAFAIGLLS